MELRIGVVALCVLALLAVAASGAGEAEPQPSRPAEASPAPDQHGRDARATGVPPVGGRAPEPGTPEPGPPGPGPADKLRAGQQQIADDFRHFQDLMLRMAELSQWTDPHRAALLKRAVRQSEEKLIGVQFDSLVELLDKERLSRAIESQNSLQQDLEALLELLLSEDRARRAESEKARIAEYLKRLNRIINEQKGLQGRTLGTSPPAPLADEQQKLADKTGDLARDIKDQETPSGAPQQDAEAKAPEPDERREGQRSGQSEEGERKPGQRPEEGKKQGEPGGPKSEGPEGKSESGRAGEAEPPQGPKQEPAQGQPDQPQAPGPGSPPDQAPLPSPPHGQNENPSRRRIQAAEQRMREAREKLQQAEREGAVEKQDEAIRELEQAKAELERILRQLREEEIERMLTTLQTRVQKMLDMQTEVHEGTVRLDKTPEDERTHNHEIEASRLSRKEAEIILEADKALAVLHDDGTAVAFPEALEQARDDMREVAGRLGRAEVGPLTQALEKDIIAALEEMLEALEQAKQEAKEQRPMPPMPARPQDQPLVDLLAEIKMIRAMQMRVNRRTEHYSKLIDGEQAESPDLVAGLRQLAERQARIHQITRDLQSGRNP